MEESRLLKMVVGETKRVYGGIGVWEEYDVLGRKFELNNEGG